MSERRDDPSIEDDEQLFRRILPQWIHREVDGSCRPQSLAFVDRKSYELSVHRARLTSPNAVLAAHPSNSLVAFRAGMARELGYKVVSDPQDTDPSHVLICPTPEGRNAKTIARSCTWVVLKG
jgi:hypothetical protein